MASNSASFRWRAESMLDTLTGFAQAVEDTLQPHMKAGDAVVLEYLRDVEIPRLKAIYALSGDGSRPRPPFEQAPPTDVPGFFKELIDTKKEESRPATSQIESRIDQIDPLKPMKTSNRVQKHKNTKQRRSTGLKGNVLFLKHQEMKNLSLGRKGQPPFVRFPVTVLLNSSQTFKRLVEAKHQRILVDTWDKVCHNPRNPQVIKPFINDFTVYINGFLDSAWAKKQAGYTELADLGKDTIWNLVVWWSNFVNGDEKFGIRMEGKAVTKEDLANLAIFGKFWKVGPEFDAELEKVKAYIEKADVQKEKAMSDTPLDHIANPQFIMGRPWDMQLLP